jgi:hypothetical protein
MTVQELFNALERRKKTLADVDNATFYDWADRVNTFAYRILYANEPERYIETELYNVISGTQEYDIPEKMLTISPLPCGFYIVNTNGDVTVTKLPKTWIGSNQPGYYFNKDKVIFTSYNQPPGQIALKYIPKIAPISSMADEVVIPEEFIWYAVNALDVCYDIWDEDDYAEGLADQRFSNTLMEFAKFLRRDTATTAVNTYSSRY